MLPYSRDQTLQPGQTVPAALINALQDGQVTLSQTLTAPERVAASEGTQTAGTAGSTTAGGSFQSSNVDNQFTVWLPYRPGWRLKRFAARVTPGAQTITMALHKVTDGVVGAQIATAVSSGAGVQDISQASDELLLLSAKGVIYKALFTFTGGGAFVHTVEWEAALV